jgi:phosphatidylinositol kinase/protein kinase (PI-3  family)
MTVDVEPWDAQALPGKHHELVEAETALMIRLSLKMELSEDAEELIISTGSDSTYVPELQDEKLMDKYFKIHVPGADKFMPQIREYYAQEGSAQAKERIKSLLRPLLVEFQATLKEQGRDVQLYLDLWEMKDEWTCPVDNQFAATFSEEIIQSARLVPSQELCEICTSFNPYEPVSREMIKKQRVNLVPSASSCFPAIETAIISPEFLQTKGNHAGECLLFPLLLIQVYQTRARICK